MNNVTNIVTRDDDNVEEAGEEFIILENMNDLLVSKFSIARRLKNHRAGTYRVVVPDAGSAQMATRLCRLLNKTGGV